MRHKGYIIMSQSTLKGMGIRYVKCDMLQDDDKCPKKFYMYYVGKTHSFDSQSMDKGVYMELGMLGETRGEKRPTLPLKKNGDKYAWHKRIDEQIEHFPHVVEAFKGHLLKDNVQVPISCMYKGRKETIVLTGVADWITALMDKHISVVDIKYTAANLNKEAFTPNYNQAYHDYAWSSKDKLNTIQAALYRYIIKHSTWNIFKKYMDYNNFTSSSIDEDFFNKMQNNFINFYYWIFSDYKFEVPQEQIRIIRHKPDAIEEKTIEYILEEAIKRYTLWEDLGWPANYSENDCKGCPVKLECDAYKNKDIFNIID